MTEQEILEQFKERLKLKNQEQLEALAILGMVFMGMMTETIISAVTEEKNRGTQ